MKISGKAIGIGVVATIAAVIVAKKMKEGPIPAVGQPAIRLPGTSQGPRGGFFSRDDSPAISAMRRRA